MKSLIQAITTDKNLSVVGRTCWNRQQYDRRLNPQSDHLPIVWWLIMWILISNKRIDVDFQKMRFAAMLCSFFYFLILSYVEHLLEILTSGGIGIDGIEQVKVPSISENNICLKRWATLQRECNALNLTPPSWVDEEGHQTSKELPSPSPPTTNKPQEEESHNFQKQSLRSLFCPPITNKPQEQFLNPAFKQQSSRRIS